MKVLVTGIGIVTSTGITKRNVEQAFFEGKDGITDIERFDVSKIKVKRGYEIKFDLPEVEGTSSRVVQLGYLAAKEALESSGLSGEKDICLMFGSGLGDEETIIKLHNAVELKESIPTRVGPQLAEMLNLSGGVINTGSACAAGLSCIGYGYDLIKSGEYDYVLVGGNDSISINSTAYFSRVTLRPPDNVRPFDKDRVGMLMGEGAGFLVLESEESAKKRNAGILAEVLGYARSCDAYHMSNMNIEGITKVISESINAAGITPGDVDHIVAHGTGTRINDVLETRAIKEVYGQAAEKVAVSSVKSMIGHTSGASGVIGSISGIMALENQQLPPTINLDNPDPECDLFYVPNKTVKTPLNYVQVNAFGFGGINCSLILGR